MLIRPQNLGAKPLSVLFSGQLGVTKVPVFAGDTEDAKHSQDSPKDGWQRETYPIRSAQPLNAEEAERHQVNIQRVLKHAQAAAQIPNHSGRHFAALVETEDGIETMAANYEASREIPTCDLRAALTAAYNKQVDAQTDKTSPPDLKVRTVYLVNADPQGEQPIPCADCQALLNSDAFQPETRVVGLHHDEASKENFIFVRPLKAMLPLHKGEEPRPVLTTAKPLETLPVALSENAKKSLQKADGVTQKKLVRLLERAQSAYDANDTSEYSKKRTGTGAMISPFNLMIGGSRFEWTTRWFESPDLVAAAQGFQETKRVQRFFEMLPKFLQKLLNYLFEVPKVKALAYYGDDPQLPPVASLGRIGRRRGDSDTLIVTVENDKIQVRTVGDYMPEMYTTPDPKTK